LISLDLIRALVGMQRFTLFGMVTLLLAANTACAASYDCDKASTKVEKMICTDPELSKMDEKLGSSYHDALKTVSNPFALRLQQRKWMKLRNQCTDKSCLEAAYQGRIDEIIAIAKEKRVPALHAADQTYALLMSKNDKMCNYMRNLMEADLHQIGRGYGTHDRFVSTNDVFNAVPWKPARASFENGGKKHYTEDWQLKGALFDLNNDGVLDFVVRDQSMLSGLRVDRLYMLDQSNANRANSLTIKELFESANQLSMDQVRYFLSSESGMDSASLWLLSPFIYQDVTYIYMQSLYMDDEATALDFVVISKYLGGKFKRQTTGRMEDVCYIQRLALGK